MRTQHITAIMTFTKMYIKEIVGVGGKIIMITEGV